jgi:NAD(P)-dependent dehydrogenase (short-subunit alcohol dehydrogenase family)
MSHRVVAITGAQRGIGLAIARRFAAAGDRLALNYLDNAGALDEVAAAARAQGGACQLIQADLSRREQAEAFVRQAEAHYGRLDVLVNNAGVLHIAPAGETPWEQWDRMIAINLTATFACLRAALPGMIARKSGRIINISSELGLMGAANYAAYCASKGGVIALTKAVAKEAAPHGVLVNSVAPGPIDTDMLRDSDEFTEAGRLALPIKRFGTPDEIARAVEFLAGPGGDYFVGQVISPNGGAVI